MQLFPCLVILILAGMAVFSAGCTQEAGSAPPVTPVNASSLKDLALSLPDLPSCFSLAEQHEKRPGEVGMLAKDLGWQEGYVVRYTCPSDGREQNVITHSLAVYPAENMPGIASMVNEQDRLNVVAYENLSFMDQRTAMRGFFGKAGGVQGSPLSPGAFLVSGMRTDTTTYAESAGTMAEIIFYRGTRFEVLRMTGPGTNATFLHELASIAEKKIP